MGEAFAEHFQLSEFTRSNAPHPNTPDAAQTACLERLARTIMDPIRDHVGRPVHVTSGFRSSMVNDWLARQGYPASKTSQHLAGEACDFTIHDDGMGRRLIQLWLELSRGDVCAEPLQPGVRNPVKFGQLILYTKNSLVDILHISLPNEKHRGEVFAYNKHCGGSWEKYRVTP